MMEEMLNGQRNPSRKNTVVSVVTNDYERDQRLLDQSKRTGANPYQSRPQTTYDEDSSMMGGVPVCEDFESSIPVPARQPIPSFAKMFLFGSQVNFR